MKIINPYFTFVLLLSLLVNLAPQPIHIGDMGSRVHGFWEDLLGSSDKSDSPSSSIDTSNEISKIFLEISGVDGESIDASHSQWKDALRDKSFRRQ